MSLKLSVFASTILLVGCGLRLSSPDGRIDAGGDAQIDQSAALAAPDAKISAGKDVEVDQSSSLVKNPSVEVAADHSRASGVDAESITGGNVVNFVVQAVEKSPWSVLRAFCALSAALLVLLTASWLLWRRSRRLYSDLDILIRAVEAAGAEVKQKVAKEDARRSPLGREVQKRTSPTHFRV